MKHVFIMSIAAAALMFASCSKQTASPQNQLKGEPPVINAEIKKYDYFACVGTDGAGNQYAGRRCGTPNGSECKKVESGCTPLKTLDPSEGELKDIRNLTAQEFKAMWKDANGNKMLRSRGFVLADF